MAISIVVAAGILAASIVTAKAVDSWVAGIARAGCLEWVVSTTGFALAVGIALVEVAVSHLGLAAGTEVAAVTRAKILPLAWVSLPVFAVEVESLLATRTEIEMQATGFVALQALVTTH